MRGQQNGKQRSDPLDMLYLRFPPISVQIVSIRKLSNVCRIRARTFEHRFEEMCLLKGPCAAVSVAVDSGAFGRRNTASVNAAPLRAVLCTNPFISL